MAMPKRHRSARAAALRSVNVRKAAGFALCAGVAVAAAVVALADPARRTATSARAHADLARPAKDPAPRARSSWLLGRGGPISFQTRACVAFAPVARWNGRTVFLDPGHGGFDPGTLATVSGDAVAEKRVTLAVGLRALALLRDAGFRVVMSRVRDSTVARLGPGDVSGRLLTAAGARRDIAARNLCANAAGASVLLGVHMNAFGDPSVAGAETIYCPARRFSGRSRHLAVIVQRALLTSLRRAGWRVPDRSVLSDRAAGTPALSAQGAAYGHLLELGPADPPWFRYPSLMAGVIAEPLFLTNPAEARVALGASGQLAIARGLVRALETYFGLRGVR